MFILTYSFGFDQSRVIHKGSQEWEQIQKAVERCLDMAKSNGDNNQETCMELLETLRLSQCTLLMGYDILVSWC